MHYAQQDKFIEDDELTEGLDDLSDLSANQLSNVSVTGVDWTVGTIFDQIKKGNILLDPYFQRRDAWTPARKSQYVESLLLGIPVPQVVLGEVPGTRGKFVVIDGKQRLLSIVQFYASTDQFDHRYNVLKLRDLPILKQLNGRTKSDIEGDLHFADFVNAFENQDIRTNIVRNLNNDDVLYQIFLRLNTGSVKLSPQELRRALTPGNFWVHVDQITENSEGLAWIFNGKLPDFRMREVELLLRFVAFRRFIAAYDGSLKRFLDRVSGYFSRDWDEKSAEFDQLVNQFERAAETAIVIFGLSAFQKYRDGRYEGRFNRAVFDVMMYYFADADIARASRQHGDSVKQAFERLCVGDDEFLNSIERTTKSVGATRYRLSAWAHALSEAIGTPVMPAIVAA